MIVHDVEQGTQEWLNLRLGCFTASDMGLWVIAGDGKRNKKQEGAALNAICKKLAEISGSEMAPMFKSWAMERGTSLEPEARIFYTEETGNEVEQVGFCTYSEEFNFGCSPDGFIKDRKGMLEIKCPEPQTHVKYLLQGVLPDTYKVQVHMQMAVTGALETDFYSYCPNLPSFLVNVQRNELTEGIRSGLIRLCSEFDGYQSQMATLWKSMQTRKLVGGVKVRDSEG